FVSPGLCGGGKKSEVARGPRDVVIDALGDRFAYIARLEHSELTRTLFDPVGQLAQDARSRVGTHPWPRSMIRGFTRRIDRMIDFVGAGARHLRQLAFGGRFDVEKTRGLGRVNVASGDEQSCFHFACSLADRSL